MQTVTHDTSHPLATYPNEVLATQSLEVAGPALPLDPAWDEARRLLAAGRELAGRLACEILRLRDLYLQDKHRNLRRGNSPTAQTVPSGKSEGFQAKLSSELGLHHEQAKRILESARYQQRIDCVVEAEIGETITWEEDDQPHSFRVTAEAQQIAIESRWVWGIPYAPTPMRQWAGIATGEATKGKARADVNHAANIAKGLQKLNTSLRYWDTLTPMERKVLEECWSEVAAMLPGSWGPAR
jgi:hypothetical protein